MESVIAPACPLRTARWGSKVLTVAAVIVLCAPESALGQRRETGRFSAQVATESVPPRMHNRPATGEDGKSSGAPVLFTAFFGASLGGGLAGYLTGGLDEPSLAWSLGFIAGTAPGGMLGAHFGYRKPAPLATAIGTAVGGLPLLAITASEATHMNPIVVIPAVVLPLAGAWLGNTLGQ